MREQETSSDLGSLLKALLKEKSWSMRKLSQLSGIETATISRIVNGKQQARPKHLQQFAQALNVPVEQLFEAAGYGIKAQKKRSLFGLSHLVRGHSGSPFGIQTVRRGVYAGTG